MTTDLDALTRLCEQATPGPWTYDCPTAQLRWQDGDAIREVSLQQRYLVTVERDLCFIAAARTALPALIEEVERLRTVARLAEVMAEWLAILNAKWIEIAETVELSEAIAEPVSKINNRRKLL